MRTCRNKQKIGLIYTLQIQPQTPSKKPSQTSFNRPRAGSITNMTPKRIQSLGKIILRSSTHISHSKSKEHLKSIQVQTMDIIPIMDSKAVQVQALLESKLEKQRVKQTEATIQVNNKGFERVVRTGIEGVTRAGNKPGLLRVADFNVLSEQAHNLSKTIRKKCENLYPRQNKQNYQKVQPTRQTETNQKQFRTEHKSMTITVPLKDAYLSKQSLGRRPTQQVGRQQKISKLSALYEKNLARYQTSKVALGDLLKEKTEGLK